MKVVLNTNVFVSGVFFSGPAAKFLQAWRDGQIELSISQEILSEYYCVGEILGLEHPKVDLNPFLDFIGEEVERISAPPLPSQVCADPTDDKFLACALASRSKLVVSGDKHLLQVSGYRGIEVLKPREFLTQHITDLSRQE